MLRDQTRKRSSYLLTRSCIQNQPKLVRTHSACIWCWDKPRATLDSHDSPRPGLGRCHHHPPYSILCVHPREWHPNGSFSRDSQSVVSKLSRCRNPTLAKCGGEAQHFQSWGFGVLRDSRMFRARQQSPKHLALKCSWCHWKGLEA